MIRLLLSGFLLFSGCLSFATVKWTPPRSIQCNGNQGNYSISLNLDIPSEIVGIEIESDQIGVPTTLTETINGEKHEYSASIASLIVADQGQAFILSGGNEQRMPYSLKYLRANGEGSFTFESSKVENLQIVCSESK